MVHGVLRQTRGHVHVRSNVGQGTTIKLFFPRIDTVDQMSAQELTDTADPTADWSQ